MIQLCQILAYPKATGLLKWSFFLFSVHTSHIHTDIALISRYFHGSPMSTSRRLVQPSGTMSQAERLWIRHASRARSEAKSQISMA